MAFNSRLADFKNRFTQLLGGKPEGYDELSALERPLVGAEDDDDYDRAHGVARPGSDAAAAYRPPAAEGAAPTPSGGSFSAAVPAPSQAEEMHEMSVLSKDAAELLWEMVLMDEAGPEVQDLRSKATQLQAQLRGLIGDYTGGDEVLLGKSLEAFEMLSRCLEETPSQEAAEGAVPGVQAPAAAPVPPAAAPAPVPAASAYSLPVPPPAAPPPPPAAPAQPAGGDLISFD